MVTETKDLATTARVAEFCADLGLADVGERMIQVTKRHILDQLGVELACAELPWIQIVHDYGTAVGRPGLATVVGTGERLDAEYAAFINGTAGHGFEFDDGCAGASAHPGCVAVPAALGIGEELDASGADVLLATILGNEIITRVGRATNPTMLLVRGFHETCAEGVFGSAVVTGKLLGLNAPQMIMALGLAGSHASGTTEYTQSGGDVKRLHAGIGAMGGIHGARLAKLGFTAPTTIFEGKRGFLQAFCSEPHPERLTDGLGEQWEFADRASIKLMCCAGSIIAQVEALESVLNEHHLVLEDVAEVWVGTDRKSLMHIGAIGPEPPDITGAQFSTHFSLGMTLADRGNGFDAYYEAYKSNFRDERTVRAARLVRMELDSECDTEWPARWLGKVLVTTKDGRKLPGRSYWTGSPQKPIDDSQVVEKFLTIAEPRLGAHNARHVVDMVQHIETLESVRELGKLLVAEKRG